MREIIEEWKLPALGPGRAVFRKAGQLFIKGRVGKVHVFLIHFLLSQLDGLAEAINLRRGHSALEPQGVQGFFNEREKCLDDPLIGGSGHGRSPIGRGR